MRGRLAVVGGGLAGITAALGCADAGYDVTLFEARPRLGGLTHSFQRDGLWVDNGQHVFLRCCTSYLALLERLGVADQVVLQPRLDVPVRSGEHTGVGRLRRTALPAPLHLGAALARYRWLTPGERARVITAALALGRVDRTDASVDGRSFGDWLARHGQSDRAVEAVWDLIGVATLNAPAAEASLALAATVFQIGLLQHADAADIGWSRVPLQQLHGDAAARALAGAGAAVRVRERVRALDPDDGGWLVTTDDSTAPYDDVVLATPPGTTEALLPDGAVDLEPGWSGRLGASPIVNVHIVLDRPVLDTSFVAAVDSPLQWVFDRTPQAGLADGQYLALSLSAADALVERPVAEIRDLVLPALRRLLPASADAQVKEFFVTREPRATFRPAPGSGRWRPPARTRLPGLHLAGAWTDTGWPATMEGAARSGEAAVASVRGSAGRGRVGSLPRAATPRAVAR
ncbi:hydroxysqualene dehydroxylase HpnE [Nocardioides terrisoli]|uniref:hydroxysqualene dehydroxylase HpnE n=1 Tax=Nocardioides terrisoli TaxID=3388267 RepID=UPI00287BB7F2|nr:hydroxysqualene dehydroxylase HpnE [Nocardioides marmorisolisilvae]